MRNNQTSEWQPIETAPKDGTEILLKINLNWTHDMHPEEDERIGHGDYIVAAWFDPEKKWRTRVDAWMREKSPTGWREL